MDTSQFKKLEHPSDFRTLERYVDCIDQTLVKLKRVIHLTTCAH